MPSKRSYSTYALAKKVGLLETPKTNPKNVTPEYRSLEQCKDAEFYLQPPNDSMGLILLAKSMQRIHEDLFVLDDISESIEELCNLRRALLNLFVSDNAYMYEKIVVEAPNGRTNCYLMDTEVFIALCHATLRLISNDFIDVKCEDFEFVENNLLVSGKCTGKSILEFSADEIVRNLWLISEKWNILHYSREISVYLDLLQCRISMLYFQTTELTHKMMEEFSWTLRDMQQKILIHKYVSRHSNPPPKFADADRKRVFDLCIDIDEDEELQTPFMLFCLNYLIIPGAKQSYARDKPQKDTRSDKILSYVWGDRDRVRKIAEYLALPLNKFVRDNPLGDVIKDLALLHLIDAYASNIINGQFSARFVLVYETLLDMYKKKQLEVELRERKYPVIVQTFNWIGLYNYPSYYHHESVIDAFLHWLLIVSKPPWNMKIEGTALDNFNIKRYEFSWDEQFIH
jgi:hypothetical protein